MTLRSVLLADWPLKATSVALSVVLWLVASSEESASSLLAVRVRVQPPAGRSVIREPEALRATVVGPRRELLKVAGSNLLVSRLLPDTLTADSVRLDFTPGDVVLPRGADLRVQDLEPREVTVELTPVAQRLVPVRPVLRVAPEAGYELSGPVTVMPGEVRVAGPRERVQAIDSVATVGVDLARADGPFEERVPLDTAGLGPVHVFPARVTVSANVQRMGERTLWPVPVRLPSALAATLRPERDSVTVRVRGPRARLRDLTPDSVLVTLDRPGAGATRAALRVLAPAGFRAKASPDSVTLLRWGDGG